MQLYYSSSSPYARKVRMLIRALGLTDQIEEVPINVFNNDVHFLNKNPLGKIPCMVLSNQQSLIDSKLICEYIDKELGDGRMHAPLEASWQNKKYYHLSTGVCDVAVAWRVEKTKANVDAMWQSRYQNAINRSLTEIKQNLHYFEKDSIAKYSLLSVLAYLDFRHSELQWQATYPELVAYFSMHQEYTWLHETDFIELK